MSRSTIRMGDTVSSQLDNTKLAVEDAAGGCADAMLAVQNARSIAEDQSNWAVQMGIHSHHSVLRQVTDALGEAYQQLENAFSGANSAKSTLLTLTDQSGRNDLVEKSGAAADLLSTISAAVETAKGKLDNDAINNANLSQDENVMHAVHTASATTTEAFTKAGTASKAVEAYQQMLRQTPGN